MAGCVRGYAQTNVWISVVFLSDPINLARQYSRMASVTLFIFIYLFAEIEVI